jgi:vacuolar-type H+-ATPase subunit H
MFEPLTPSTMCVDRRLLSNPITQEKKTNDNLVDDARKRERFLTRVLNHFLEHWRKEYLTELREQHKVKNGSQMIRSASETLLWFMKIKFLDSYGKSVEFEI